LADAIAYNSRGKEESTLVLKRSSGKKDQQRRGPLG